MAAGELSARLRKAGDAIAPRFSMMCLADRKSKAQLLLVAGEGNIGAEPVLPQCGLHLDLVALWILEHESSDPE